MKGISHTVTLLGLDSNQNTV